MRIPVRKSGKRFALLVLLLGAAALVSTRLSRPPRLLDRATRLQATAGKTNGSYHWLSGTELFTVTPRILYARINVTTGAVQPLAINSAAGIPADETVCGDFLCSYAAYKPFSPDGRRMLTWYWDRSGKTHTSVIALDGSSVTPLPMKDAVMESTWLPDSRHVVTISAPRQNEFDINTFSLIKGEAPKKALLPRGAWGAILGVTPAGEIVSVTEDISKSGGKRARFFAFPADGSEGRTRTWLVGPPFRSTGPYRSGGMRYECAVCLSPRGDQLAWEFVRQRRALGPAFLHHWMTLVGLGEHASNELWVSRLDGSHMREIGQVELKPGEERLSEIRWTPEGRRISFLWKDAVWTVPAW